MGKKDDLLDVLVQFEQNSAESKKTQLEFLKDASQIVLQITPEDLPNSLRATSSVTLRYLSLLVKCFDHEDASIRLLAEQHYDQNIKKLIIARNAELGLRITIGNLQKSTSARSIVALLAKIDYFLHIIPISKRGQAQKFDYLSDTIANCVMRLFSRPEHIIQKSIDTHFNNILTKLSPDLYILSEMKKIATQLLFDTKGASARTISEVLFTLCSIKREWAIEIYKLSLEHIITFYQSGDKPAIGALLCLKRLLAYFDVKNNLDDLKKTIEIILILVLNGSNDISFVAFAVLEEAIKFIPSSMHDFLPNDFILNGSQSNRSSSDDEPIISPAQENPPAADEIIDPLLNPILYEEIQQTSGSPAVSVSLDLPSYETMLKDEKVSVYKYISAFLCKTFLLTGITGSLKSDNESKDSKKILALQCLIVIAKIENISDLDVVFEKRSQKITDLDEFFGHHDESLATKSIILVSILLGYMKTQNVFNSQLSHVITQPRQNSLRKRTLLEAFSNERILNVCDSKIFPQLLNTAREMCKSENTIDQSCGASFISSLYHIKTDEGENVLQTDEMIEKDFLNLFRCGILPQTSNYFEQVKCIYGLSSFCLKQYPPTKLDLVLNFDPLFNVFPGLSHQKSLDYGYLIDVMNKLTNFESSTVSNFIQFCQHMIDEKQYSVELLISIDRIIAHLNSGDFKKHVVISFLNVLTKICHERCMNLFINARLSDCREVAYEVMIVGLRCMDMLYKLTFEKRPDRKTVENMDARVVKLQNLFIPAKPNESGVSFPRQADISFLRCESLSNLYQDLQGTYTNYCNTLNLSTDQKFIEFAEACTNLCCSSFEFITFDDFNFFEDIILYLKKLIDIAPSAILKIMHQLVKLLFHKNLISMDRSLIMENGRFSESLMETPIAKNFEMLTVNKEYCDKLMNLTMGWLCPSLITPKAEPSKHIENSLAQIEDLITTMIRIFRCRGVEEKKHVILVMIELLRAGIRYDMADPNHVILDEIVKNLSKPQDCTFPELFPLMCECLIIINRISQKHELEKYGSLLIRYVQFANADNAKYALNAANILLIETINQVKYIDGFITALSQNLKTCFDYAPEESLYTWFLIFATTKPGEIGVASVTFLTNYLEWMVERNDNLNLNSLLFPLFKLPDSALNPIDFVYKALQKSDLCPLKSGALLCAIISKISEPVLKLRMQNLEENATEWIQRKFEDNFTQCYKGKLEIESFFYQHFKKNYPKSQANQDVSSLKESPSVQFSFSASEKSKLSTLLSEKNIEIDQLILAMTQSPGHIDFAMRLLVECDITQLWGLCQRLDPLFLSDTFWKHLMKEFRFQILNLDAKSAPEAQYLTTKCQELIDLCIEKCSETENYDMLLKIIANCKDIRIDLSSVTIVELNRILAFVASKSSDLISMGYLYNSVNEILSDQTILTNVQHDSWMCIDSYLDLLASIINVDTEENLNLAALFKNFKIEIDRKVDEKHLSIYNQRLFRCFSISQQALEKRSNISIDEIRRTRDSLLRHPLIYSMFFISIPAIEHGWKPSINVSVNGDLIIPLPKVHNLCYSDVLYDIKNRLLQVGWLSKAQFEDICVSLLGVLSTTPTGEEISDTPQSELVERIEYCAMAVDIFTFILLQTLKFPYNGDPVSNYILKMREKTDPFFSSNEAIELSVLKCIKKGIPKHAFNQNIERFSSSNGDGTTNSFGIGQISVLSLWTICGAVPQENGSSLIEHANRIRPSLSQHLLNTTSDLDTVSNVRSLLGIFSHWFSHGIDQLPDQLLESVVRSMLYLSDFFDDQTTYEFMYQQMKIVYDREMTANLGVDEMVRCMLLKSVAVIGIEHIEPTMELAEKKNLIMSWIADGFDFERNEMFILGGITYLLQAFSLDSLKDVINEITCVLVAEFKNKSLVFFQNINYYLAVAIQILEQPNCSDITVELLMQLIDLQIDKKFDLTNEELSTVTEAMIQLICHSVIYVEPVITKIHRFLVNARENNSLNKSRGNSIYKIYMTAIFRSAAADMRYMEILKDAFTDLLYIYTKSCVDASEKILKSLPILLVTIKGCDGTVLDLMDMIFESRDYSEISKYLLVMSEIYTLSRSNKSWGRLLRAKNEVVCSRLIDIKTKSHLIYCIVKLIIDNPTRVPALLPIDEKTTLDLNWVHE